MKHRSPTRHKPETIKSALAQLEAGRPLTEVAKKLGISKGLLSYWKNHAGQAAAGQGPSSVPAKSDGRSKLFVDRCWRGITLAFKKLESELKEEKPQGIRDLALTIAVLADKMGQVTQKLQAQAAPSPSGWAVSEDTWMLLRRHREAKISEPPKEKVVEAGLSGPGLEQQKREAGAEVGQGSAAESGPATAQPGAPGGN